MDLYYHTLPWMTLQYVRIPAYNNKLVQGWKNMCNLRFCSQLLVPIIMHFYFYFMQKSADLFDLILLFFPIRFSKTSIIDWANKTKFIIRKFQTTTWPDFNQEWLLYSNFQNVFPQKKDQQKSKRFSKIKNLRRIPHNTVLKLFWKLSAIQMIDTYLSWKSDQSLFLQGQAKARLIQRELNRWSKFWIFRCPLKA